MSLVYECENCGSTIRHLLSKPSKLIYFGKCCYCHNDTQFRFLREDKLREKPGFATTDTSKTSNSQLPED